MYVLYYVVKLMFLTDPVVRMILNIMFFIVAEKDKNVNICCKKNKNKCFMYIKVKVKDVIKYVWLDF